MTTLQAVVNKLKLLAKLNKLFITVGVGLTTAAGYILRSHDYDANLFWTVLGIFLLACSSAIINQVQEAKTDALMNRTRNRPIPSGQISKKRAWTIAILEFIPAVVILHHFAGWLALTLGLTSLVWYNLLYTHLKKTTAFAVIPGSVIGAIPPLVGWVAAGGSLLHINAIMLAVFFFIWQIPHFWMLALYYSPEYKKAGFPVLTDLYTEVQMIRQLFIMVIISAALASVLAISDLVSSMLTSVVVISLSIGLIVQFSKLLSQENKMKLHIHFRSINFYVLLVLVLLCIDHWI
jgi:protoheme IX farnesyltransferase